MSSWSGEEEDDEGKDEWEEAGKAGDANNAVTSSIVDLVSSLGCFFFYLKKKNFFS